MADIIDIIETWYTASGTQIVPGFFNENPGLTIDLYKQRLTLVPHTFYGKVPKLWITQTLLKFMIYQLVEIMS